MRPNNIRQIGIVTRYELLKYLRGRRLLAIILLTVIISGIFLVVPPAIGSQYSKDPTEFVMNMLRFLGVLSILSATFFGADAIVSEFESKTGYFLFPNPIRKTTIFLGKFIASALVSVGVIALYYLIAVVSVQVIDGSVPANTGLSFARKRSGKYRLIVRLRARVFVRHPRRRLPVQCDDAKFSVLAYIDLLHLLPHPADR